ncbi:TKL protein kinase, variant 1 [Capsaspora owczarzaki ATCC 30864]|uniref:non-specific protein-tyrosine kinase n=1 Tax=Capsaspora owczarzaki (strain ATCC 30864) TaxID=595528 RepID=A0A0D2UMV2_CAPO3|nr:TKL protein kinase, variant 1 [Capsaspora owczarzaki ATCC 30864]
MIDGWLHFYFYWLLIITGVCLSLVMRLCLCWCACAESPNTGSLRTSNAHNARLPSERQASIPTPEAASSQWEAMYDYNANAGSDEMSIVKGDIFDVYDQTDPNWWGATNIKTGARGMIPSNYIAPGQSIERNPWFHGKIGRPAAEVLLSSGINGSFLVRESESTPGEYSISVKYDGKLYHYRVTREGDTVYVTPEHVFNNMQDLVKHHSKNADGLVAPLKHPVLKKDKPTVYGLKHGGGDKWEIDKAEIKLGRKLGAGQYGDVYEGRWKESAHVAVKTLKETMEVKDFLQEAAIMKKVKHEHLVQLVGVCTQEAPFYIVTEFMPNGNLLDYLRSEAGKKLDAMTLMYMASQIASGMAYLEKDNFIHRDLAARNCLVGQNNLVKVADFGLSRLVEDEYTAREGAKFPIKWTAPESLQYNVFTTKSDVWAFGVLLWELSTYGETPYPGVELSQVLDKIETGYRMPKPKGCPDEVYALMLQCWQWKPADRPTFANIKLQLESMFPSGGVNDAVENALNSDGSVPITHYAAPSRSGASAAGGPPRPSPNGKPTLPPPVSGAPRPTGPKPTLARAVSSGTPPPLPAGGPPPMLPKPNVPRR